MQTTEYRSGGRHYRRKIGLHVEKAHYENPCQRSVEDFFFPWEQPQKSIDPSCEKSYFIAQGQILSRGCSSETLVETSPASSARHAPLASGRKNIEE